MSFQFFSSFSQLGACASKTEVDSGLQSDHDASGREDIGSILWTEECNVCTWNSNAFGQMETGSLQSMCLWWCIWACETRCPPIMSLLCQMHYLRKLETYTTDYVLVTMMHLERETPDSQSLSEHVLVVNLHPRKESLRLTSLFSVCSCIKQQRLWALKASANQSPLVTIYFLWASLSHMHCHHKPVYQDYLSMLA